MDILSYTKAAKAKKGITALNKRLGAEEFKHGENDIKGNYKNTDARLKALEDARLGTFTKSINMDLSSIDLPEGLSYDAAAGMITGAGSFELTVQLDDRAIEYGDLDFTLAETIPGTVKKAIPDMTGPSTPSPYVITASHNSGDAYKAFNDSAEYYSSGVNSNMSIDVDFGAGNQKRIIKYALGTFVWNKNGDYPARTMPGSWSLQGSNNGADWKVLHSISGEGTSLWGGDSKNTSSYIKEFDIKSPGDYRFYRLAVGRIAGGAGEYYTCNIGTIQLFEDSMTEYNTVKNDLKTASIAAKGEDIMGLPENGESPRVPKPNWIKITNDNRKPGVPFDRTIRLKITLDNDWHLKELALNYVSSPLINKISDMEKNTAINLNKHNLRVNTILDHRRYKMEEMVIECFEDQEGIDHTLSRNYVYENNIVKIAPGQEKAIVTLTKEDTSTVPSFFMISIATNNHIALNREIDLNTGILTNVLLENGKLSLNKKDGYYVNEGSYETPVIYLGENFKKITGIMHQNVMPESDSIVFLLASSADGQTFSDYKAFNQDDSFSYESGPYIKLKAIFKSKLGEVGLPMKNEPYSQGGSIKQDGSEYSLTDGVAYLRNERLAIYSADSSLSVSSNYEILMQGKYVL